MADQTNYQLWFVPDYPTIQTLATGGWDDPPYHRLKASIRKQGFLNPITARYEHRSPFPGVRMFADVGNRRVTIARELGIETVPLLVSNYDFNTRFEGHKIEHSEEEVRKLFVDGWVTRVEFMREQLFIAMKHSVFT